LLQVQNKNTPNADILNLHYYNCGNFICVLNYADTDRAVR